MLQQQLRHLQPNMWSGGRKTQICGTVSKAMSKPATACKSSRDDIWTKKWSWTTVRGEIDAITPVEGMLREFDFERPIGTGSFARVLLVSKKNNKNEKRAVKAYTGTGRPKPERYWTQALREVSVLKSTLCTDIIGFYGAWWDKDRESLYVMLENGDGGTLGNIIRDEKLRKQLTLPLLGHVIKSIANALAFLHARRLIHRDVKADNVLLTKRGQVKLGDLGLCCRLDSPDLPLCVGSPLIMSPEMIPVVGVPRKIDMKTDIWSVGITIRQMLYGPQIYPKGKKVRDLLPTILTESRTFDDIQCVNLRTLLVSCLQFKSAERPSAMEILRSEFLRTAATAEQFRPLVLETVAKTADKSDLVKSFQRLNVCDTEGKSAQTNRA